MPTVVAGAAGLQSLAGHPLGSSEWQEMRFERIQRFAEASGDFQWIHVDRERIARESPFGRPLAHGYLAMSLVGGLFFEVVELQGFQLVINCGCNKVRFPSPLREGDRYRLTLSLGDVKSLGEWLEGTFQATIELDGQAKPACAAEVVYRFKA